MVPVSDRAEWVTTTHAWALEVDVAHLADVSARAEREGTGGLRHQILEVLAYADEEARAMGRTGRATVAFGPDGTVTVTDDGRGTDTRLDAGRPVRKPVMSTKDVRFFDAPDAPLLPDGRARRGMSTVAALCPLLIHENRRTTGAWRQTYRFGVPDDDLQTVAQWDTTGTAVTFLTAPRTVGPATLAPTDLTAFDWLHIEVQTGRSGSSGGASRADPLRR